MPLHTRTQLIPRLLRTTVNEAGKDKGLPIIQYTSNTKRALSSIIFQPILQLQVPYTLPLDMRSDLIWHTGWLACEVEQPRPSWSGFMQQAFSCDGYENQKFFSYLSWI